MNFKDIYPNSEITEGQVGQVILIRKRGLLNGSVELVHVQSFTRHGKFSALKMRSGDGAFVPFNDGKLVDASDFEIVDPIELSRKPNIDPLTGCPKNRLFKRIIRRALRLFKIE